MSSPSKNNLYSGLDHNNSTLRPRNARLISFLEEGGTAGDSASKAKTTSTSTSTSTAALKRTPVAAKSRSHNDPSITRPGAEEHEGLRRGSGANGLWDSWTQIQGIASTLLGSDASTTDGGASVRQMNSVSSSAWTKKERVRATPKPSKRWGPSAPDVIGTGTGVTEERQAMVQASRREALLLSNTDEGRDKSGKFKRKDSDGSLTIRPTVQAEDALVYRHRVLPNDTMAGVTIKYSCQAETFRKVNRLWPNDRIQIRDYVLLPVDACSVRGKKVDIMDMEGDTRGRGLSNSNSTRKKEDLVNGVPSDQANVAPSDIERTSSSAVEDDMDEDYQHDSWVTLPNFPDKVEILRIPRAKLGYFPTARRKSTHHIHAPGIDSTLSSPRTSFDTLRHPPSHAAQQAQLLQQTPRSASTGMSPQRRARATTSSTISSQGSRKAANHFFSALRGPGGVGSLHSIGMKSSRPGPPDDALNQNFQKYLPSLAIIAPTERDYDTDDSYLTPRSASRTLSFNALALPRASSDSLRSTRSGRSNSSTGAFTGAGVAVENWVKKLASTGAAAASRAGSKPNLSRNNSDRNAGPLSSRMGIGGETGLGDLIELETNSNSHHNFDSEETSRSDQIQNSRSKSTRSNINIDDRSLPNEEQNARVLGGNDNESSLLDERFPIRGRISTAYTPKKK